MLYFIYGPNSFLASKKIREIKSFFLKKNPSFLIEEIDGEEASSPENFYWAVQNSSIFAQKRLFLCRNTVKSLEGFGDFLKNNIQSIKDSENIFVFWERDIKKSDKLFSLLEKYSEKTQEVKSDELPQKKQSNEIFRIADRILAQKDSRNIFLLEKAFKLGIAPKDLVNVIFWNFKRKSRVSVKEANLAFEALLADLSFKMEEKNSRENLERLVFSISKA